MMRSMLLGMVAGARSFTPLAMLALTARQSRRRARGARAGAKPRDPLRRALARPWVARGATALATYELFGDKLPSAPDRIVPAGIAARLASGSIAGAAVAPRGRRVAGALIGAGTAMAAAHLTLDARRHAMQRYGQTSSGLVEDALALGIAWLLVRR